MYRYAQTHFFFLFQTIKKTEIEWLLSFKFWDQVISKFISNIIIVATVKLLSGLIL